MKTTTTTTMIAKWTRVRKLKFSAMWSWECIRWKRSKNFCLFFFLFSSPQMVSWNYIFLRIFITSLPLSNEFNYLFIYFKLRKWISNARIQSTSWWWSWEMEWRCLWCWSFVVDKSLRSSWAGVTSWLQNIECFAVGGHSIVGCFIQPFIHSNLIQSDLNIRPILKRMPL